MELEELIEQKVSECIRQSGYVGVHYLKRTYFNFTLDKLKNKKLKFTTTNEEDESHLVQHHHTQYVTHDERESILG